MTTKIAMAPRLAWRTTLVALVATGALAGPADKKPFDSRSDSRR